MEVGELGGRAIHFVSKIESVMAEENRHPSSEIFLEFEARTEEAGSTVRNAFLGVKIHLR